MNVKNLYAIVHWGEHEDNIADNADKKTKTKMNNLYDGEKDEQKITKAKGNKSIFLSVVIMMFLMLFIKSNYKEPIVRDGVAIYSYNLYTLA